MKAGKLSRSPRLPASVWVGGRKQAALPGEHSLLAAGTSAGTPQSLQGKAVSLLFQPYRRQNLLQHDIDNQYLHEHGQTTSPSMNMGKQPVPP